MIEKTVFAEDVLGRGVVKDFYKSLGISKTLAKKAKLALVYFVLEPADVRIALHRKSFNHLSPELSYRIYCANKVIHTCASLASQTSRNFALTEINSGRFPIVLTIAEQLAFGLPVKVAPKQRRPISSQISEVILN